MKDAVLYSVVHSFGLGTLNRNNLPLLRCLFGDSRFSVGDQNAHVHMPRSIRMSVTV